MSSRPSSAACVGVEQGHQAAQLMARILTNQWNEVHILVPNTSTGKGYDIGTDMAKLIDEGFDVYGEDKIPYGVRNFGEYMQGTVDHGALHVLIYDKFSELQELDSQARAVIAVRIPDGTIDFRQFVEETSTLQNTVHTRAGVGQNAAMFVAHCLYISHENLKPKRFTDVRRRKSGPNVEEYLRLTQDRDLELNLPE